MRAKDATETNGVSFKKTRSKTFAKRFGSHIRIGRKDYKIIYCDEVTDESATAIAGCCILGADLILVDVTRELEATLCHEIIHATLHEAGFHQRGDWSQDNEEALAEVISQTIAHQFNLRKKT